MPDNPARRGYNPAGDEAGWGSPMPAEYGSLTAFLPPEDEDGASRPEPPGRSAAGPQRVARERNRSDPGGAERGGFWRRLVGEAKPAPAPADGGRGSAGRGRAAAGAAGAGVAGVATGRPAPAPAGGSDRAAGRAGPAPASAPADGTVGRPGAPAAGRPGAPDGARPPAPGGGRPPATRPGSDAGGGRGAAAVGRGAPGGGRPGVAGTRPVPAVPPAGRAAPGSAAPGRGAAPIGGAPEARSGWGSVPVPAAAAVGAATVAAGPDTRRRPPPVTAPEPRRRSRRWAQSRGVIRHFDVWSVTKVSFMFYLLVLVAVVVASVMLWYLADALGAITSIEKSARTLFSLKSFKLHPSEVAVWTSLGGAVLAVVGTLINVLAALMYNLISDVVGGVELDFVDDVE